ncbi:NAD-glutamate dehydrogenase [Spiribacter vilamensis]|uniref:Glutamate dehydrogenase (NAD) n=1 Tax=Spiribacter vilamensis TaxID=531306 RepID=A0A4V2GJA0_9GAMM|nr:NAD-glutamate dehydrogenase [Spiribacter vilamensis]RZU99485.1 glutamate dehydrogenase (NAD) [Spiribacter vilamensis]TVO61543.1 NAD-glutamate dehydrogenase [Spiribacter vilamensis]
MNDNAETARERQIEALEQLADQRWPDSERAVIRRFLDCYYASTATEDLTSRQPATLYGAAVSHWRLGDRRPDGEIALRVYNPDPEQDGWESTHSIVQIVADDQPFLIDSLSMAMNEQGLMIHLITHPVLEVTRDTDRRATGVSDQSASDGDTEAWIHIEVDRQATPEQLQSLEDVVRDTLRDVEVAVTDWQSMHRQAQQARRSLKRQAPDTDDDYLAEVDAFLEWMLDEHFTFLGYRRYDLRRVDGTMRLQAVRDTGLGLLRAERNAHRLSQSFEALPPALREQASDPDPLILTKSSHRSTVHRHGYMDTIGVKRFNARGEVIGEHRFLGLYTSGAYSRNPRKIPLLRRKVAAVLERAGLRSNSHAGKALVHILETYPRDELFEIDSQTLYETALGILQLQERQRVRLFLRHDRFGRFVSCLVYAPRDRYDTTTRQRMEKILIEAFNGAHSEFTVQLSEAVLARIHFIVHFRDTESRAVDTEALEARLAATTRSWSDDLAQTLLEHCGEARGTELHHRYRDAFSAAYREDTGPGSATQDIERLETLATNNGLVISLYRPLEAPVGSLRLKLYHAGHPISLSDVLPVLENMGVRVIDERPYGIRPDEGEQCWIHDFGLSHDPDLTLDTGRLRDAFQSGFAAIWRHRTDDDGFNRLILLAGLAWRDIVVLRAYAQYLRQAGTAYSQPYMEYTLADHPAIASGLIDLFRARFDPDSADTERADRIAEDLTRQLDAVESLDDDRILRRLLDAMRATLRTNFFQRDDEDQVPETVAIKLRPDRIPGVPKPVPAFEIFVSSPRVEGVHLRGGKVARGGLRWSERREDYRTEILGLMKAQMVKNALIVPVGAKGGFVCKRLPRERGAQQAEVLACYRLFIRGLLDVTDNIVDDAIQPPDRVIRHDDDDPYLVVAADKGTASFSDDANAIAEEYGFWLHDGFASGGSTGYDHKVMGITARGAWVAVQRHFRERGRDIQTQPFTAVGVGDMSGDVFGNGMLQSPTTRLIAAFDHRHVFIDPDPDPERSYIERERLFGQGPSSWADYDKSVISTGGGVWPRSAKSITLPAAAREALGLDRERLTPTELIAAILRAPVDLLWNGGIGTYIKARSESHAEVGDKANDSLRVDAEDLRCQVVGEGGNLGVTPLGRVAFALAGGQINNDAIDNSGGVDCSDHEVNIKILMNAVVDDGDLTVKQRNRLLGEMTDAVAEHVLANNYRQTQGISLMLDRAAERLSEQGRCMRRLEREGRLDRVVEQLPDDETLAEREKQGLGLTRPELAILLSYTKIRAFEQLLESPLVEGEENLHELVGYFPAPLRERFANRIDQHPLRREIIANHLANHVLNRMGATFLLRMTEATGADITEAVRAYLAARDIYGLRGLWYEVDRLDNRVATHHQQSLLHTIRALQEQATRWLLRHQSGHNGDAVTTRAMQQAIGTLDEALPALLTDAAAERLAAEREEHVEAGVPEALAERMSRVPKLYPGLDISAAATLTGAGLTDAAGVHFQAADHLALNELRAAIDRFRALDDWQARYRIGLMESLHEEHRRITEAILRHTAAEPADKRVETCLAAQGNRVDYLRQITDQISASAKPDAAMFGVALQALRQVAADAQGSRQ